MALIADIFLTAGALAAGLYCFVLSRRLRRFTDLEHGVGGAIAVLSVQVDDLSKALQQADKASTVATGNLEKQCQKAEMVSKRMELLIASMHDLPEPTSQAPNVDPFFVRDPLFAEKVG